MQGEASARAHHARNANDLMRLKHNSGAERARTAPAGLYKHATDPLPGTQSPQDCTLHPRGMEAQACWLLRREKHH